MAGFDHGPNHPVEVEDMVAAARRSRIGLWLFGVYCLLYGGFMLLNAFAPGIMERTPFGGVNLAMPISIKSMRSAWSCKPLMPNAWACNKKSRIRRMTWRV